MAKPKEFRFVLEDLERPHKKLGGKATLENGMLQISLADHGNSSEEHGPVVAVQLDMGIARLLAFRDINSEEPTESMDLDGALESRREK